MIVSANIGATDTVLNFACPAMFAETIMRYYRHDSINQMFSQLPDHVIEAGLDLAGLKL